MKKSSGFVKKGKRDKDSDSSDDEGNAYFGEALAEVGNDEMTELLGDNRTCTIKGTEKVKIQLHDGSSFILKDVRIKVIKGCRVMMTGIKKKNCVYTLEAKVMTFGVQKHGGSKQVGFKQLGHTQGAQGNREAEVFQVSNDDAAVAQRRLEDKQLEEKTNTDCLVKEQEKVHLSIKVGANITVTGVPEQEGTDGKVAEKKKVKESIKANLGKLLKYKAWLTRRSPIRVTSLFTFLCSDLTFMELWVSIIYLFDCVLLFARDDIVSVDMHMKCGSWEVNDRIMNEQNVPLGVTLREVMLEKQLTGHRVDRSICAWFWEHSISQPDILPVIASPTHYIFQILRQGITFLACTQLEMPPLMGIEVAFFYSLFGLVADVLSDYLGGLNEDVIKDNFVIVYELLDEMIDNGFPLTTEPNILRDMIAPPNIVSKMLSVVTGNSSNVNDTLPGATSSCVPWRTTQLKHTHNDVYVNLVEEMDTIINRHVTFFTFCYLSHFFAVKADKQILEAKCEIFGVVEVNSHLSGIPDLTLSFANPSILNDVQFHPCVRFRPWESQQLLSFVPPDGLFKLMNYRVKKLKNTPIYVKPQLSSESGTCRVSVMVGIRNDPGKAIDSVVVQFQLPPCVSSANLTANHGTVNILADKTCSWSIGRIPKDKAPQMSGTLVLEEGLEQLHVKPTFQVGFKIMGVALSGLKLNKLDLKNLPTPAHKGFRAQTEAGQYEVRS
ncbi:AP-3 complex subunit mu [Tanacetum coccineum]